MGFAMMMLGGTLSNVDWSCVLECPGDGSGQKKCDVQVGRCVDDQLDADVFTGLRSEESMKIIKVPSCGKNLVFCRPPLVRPPSA